MIRNDKLKVVSYLRLKSVNPFDHIAYLREDNVKSIREVHGNVVRKEKP